MSGETCRCEILANPDLFNTEVNREGGLRANQLADAILPRKTSSELRVTVPKPTQVGEASSLRRSR